MEALKTGQMVRVVNDLVHEGNLLVPKGTVTKVTFVNTWLNRVCIPELTTSTGNAKFYVQYSDLEALQDYGNVIQVDFINKKRA